MKKSRLLLFPLLLATACTVARIGPKNVSELRVAHTASGVSVNVSVRTTIVRGELLEAADDHVLMLSNNILITIRYSDARALAPDDMAKIKNNYAVPTTVEIARLKNMSRFPAGILATQLADLLAERKQTAPQEIK